MIREYLSQGAVFSFSVCRGHIALVSGPADDETMVHITDSAPGATFERIRNASVYILKRPGVYRAVRSPDQIPGMRWYMDTEEYGGAEYYMTLDYVSGRGVRLIMKEE